MCSPIITKCRMERKYQYHTFFGTKLIVMLQPRTILRGKYYITFHNEGVPPKTRYLPPPNTHNTSSQLQNYLPDVEKNWYSSGGGIPLQTVVFCGNDGSMTDKTDCLTPYACSRERGGAQGAGAPPLTWTQSLC